MSESGTFDFQTQSDSSYIRKTVIQAYNYQPEPFMLSEDTPRRLVGETMKRWTFRSFDAYDSHEVTVPIDVTFSMDQTGVHGRINNRSNFNIEESFFLYDRRNAANLGTVKANSQREFTLPLKNDHYPPILENYLRDMIHLYTATYSNPHFFFGKIQDDQGALVINGSARKAISSAYVAVYADSPEAMPLNPWAITVRY